MRRPLPCKVGDRNMFAPITTLTSNMIPFHYQSGDKEGSCKLCGKTFPTSRGLVVHLSKHFADKKFPCEFEMCSNKYTTVSNLKKHITNAHGGDLFHCEICRKKSFTSRTKLEAHQAVNCAKDVIEEPSVVRPMPQLIPMPMKEESGELIPSNLSLFTAHNGMKRE